METKTLGSFPEPAQSVLTVPMRNGNNDGNTVINAIVVGSYRTYEEWKLFW